MKADLGSDLWCGPGYWVAGWSWYSVLCVKSLQLCPTLCDPTDCSPPGSSVNEMLQTRIPEWVAMPSSRGSSPPRDRTHIYVSALAGGFFTTSATWEALCVCVCVYTHICVYMCVCVCVLTLSFVKVIFLTIIRWALYKTDLKFLYFFNTEDNWCI